MAYLITGGILTILVFVLSFGVSSRQLSISFVLSLAFPLLCFYFTHLKQWQKEHPGQTKEDLGYCCLVVNRDRDLCDFCFCFFVCTCNSRQKSITIYI